VLSQHRLKSPDGKRHHRYPHPPPSGPIASGPPRTPWSGEQRRGHSVR
jgi:hypothetical protein